MGPFMMRLRMQGSKLQAQDGMSIVGDMMTTSIRIHQKLGLRFESRGMRYHGLILSGYLKGFQDMLSLSGWILKIDYLWVFE